MLSSPTAEEKQNWRKPLLLPNMALCGNRWSHTHIEEDETSDHCDDDRCHYDASENVNVHETFVVVCGRSNEVVEEILVGR